MALLGGLLATPMKAEAATVVARTSLSVSAVVLGGCTANMSPGLSMGLSLGAVGGVQVACQVSTPFSVHAVSGDDASNPTGRPLIEVHY